MGRGTGGAIVEARQYVAREKRKLGTHVDMRIPEAREDDVAGLDGDVWPAVAEGHGVGLSDRAQQASKLRVQSLCLSHISAQKLRRLRVRLRDELLNGGALRCSLVVQVEVDDLCRGLCVVDRGPNGEADHLRDELARGALRRGEVAEEVLVRLLAAPEVRDCRDERGEGVLCRALR